MVYSSASHTIRYNMSVSVLGLRFKLLLFKCEIKPVSIDFLTHYPKHNRPTKTVINNWIFSIFSVQSLPAEQSQF